ncbi:tetratricopeptide repeat protein [Tamlana sp. 2_MG-2023]|uniref:tetratricopeptide repeat protein n=1 Tax=unclassified Tamlana TaxID=2614803 RepID=UPI0026E1D9F5|nr:MULTISPECIES: tetratricopeptide repeat protein [unclassified Tamlana]MDO6759936.1 tetratricopeptide repeat protein [Tamlana sp. 2_MG-2023]MDO6791894.1 tetratricopeptide repeat protein [Tamlana sp. 1_MG-2023]
MKQIITTLVLFITFFAFSQADDEEQLLAAKKANDFVYEGNDLVGSEDFVSAEMAYRKAISEQETSVAAAYNLANAYIKSDNLEEALFRLEQAAKEATSKDEKHKAFHNIGNVLMKNEKCKEAVEAYKSALRNDPSDEETRYNLALAKKCAEEQKDQNDQNDDQNDENQDNKDQENQDDKDNKENEDKKDQEGDNEDENEDKDQENEDKKDGEDEKDDEGKPKDDKKDPGKDQEDKKDKGQPQPQPGQLSPQQIKNLLEAMNNQEQEVQEKINAEKQKGVKIKSEKDW